MISAYAPISDSFVAAGTSESQIQVSQFPNVDSEVSWVAEQPAKGMRHFEFSGVTRPTTTTILGKCSHWPVNDIAHMGEHVAAVSAATLSTWDLVKGRRVRHVTTPDHATTCNYIGERLIAASGHGRSIHLYDTRLNTSNPAWTAKVATDNLYTSAVDGCTVFAAGADGCIYGVDLRASHQYKWDLQPNLGRTHSEGGLRSGFRNDENGVSNAVLDLEVFNGNLFFTLESGHVCAIPREFDMTSSKSVETMSDDTSRKLQSTRVTGGDYTFQAKYSSTPVTTKIGCDVVGAGNDIHIVVGCELGGINYYSYNQEKKIIEIDTKIHGFDEDFGVLNPQWAPAGLYASMGDALCLLPFQKQE
ncbi:hypothetical protein OXX59_002278 [Metschnikowia pulcherrima]